MTSEIFLPSIESINNLIEDYENKFMKEFENPKGELKDYQRENLYETLINIIMVMMGIRAGSQLDSLEYSEEIYQNRMKLQHFLNHISYEVAIDKENYVPVHINYRIFSHLSRLPLDTEHIIIYNPQLVNYDILYELLVNSEGNTGCAGDKEWTIPLGKILGYESNPTKKQKYYIK